MKWLALLAWDPATALDWRTKDGGLDHGKVLSDLVIGTFVAVLSVVALRTKTFPPVLWGITAIAGAMGSRVFIAFLRSKTDAGKRGDDGEPT
jgi:hypothetical protein